MTGLLFFIPVPVSAPHQFFFFLCNCCCRRSIWASGSVGCAWLWVIAAVHNFSAAHFSSSTRWEQLSWAPELVCEDLGDGTCSDRRLNILKYLKVLYFAVINLELSFATLALWAYSDSWKSLQISMGRLKLHLPEQITSVFKFHTQVCLISLSDACFWFER